VLATKTQAHTKFIIQQANTHRIMKLLIRASLILLLSFTSPAFAGDGKLFGHWKGGGIDINLKSNHTFSYKVKIVKMFNFTGTWSTKNNKIIMRYKVAGIKQKKVASYRFKGKKLLLTLKGKGEATLKKQ